MLAVVFFSDVEELSVRLRDRDRMAELHANARRHRLRCTLDDHANDLVDFCAT